MLVLKIKLLILIQLKYIFRICQEIVNVNSFHLEIRFIFMHLPKANNMSRNKIKVVCQTLDRQTLDTTNPGQTNNGHNKH